MADDSLFSGFIDGLITYLVQLLLSALNGLFYPVTKLFKMIIGWVVYVWDSFYGLLNSFISLFNNFYDFVKEILYIIFPSKWMMLICLGLFIVMAQVLYSYLKDVGIFGFKI